MDATLFHRCHLGIQAYPARLGEQWSHLWNHGEHNCCK